MIRKHVEFLVFAVLIKLSKSHAPTRSQPIIDTSVVQVTVTDKVYYVDKLNGNNNNDGLTEETAVEELRYAMGQIASGTTVYVKEGWYTNYNYGTGELNNYSAANFKNLNDVKLTNYPGHSPVIKFDGVAGINIQNGERLEVSGFEIIGPAYDISYDEAMDNRLIQDNYYNGRGIAIWTGNHIRIKNNTVHAAPGCGIRANNHDYVSFEFNTVFDCTWWTSHAEAAVVFAQSTSVDDLDITKLFMVSNEIFDNINKIPFYAEYMDDQDYMDDHQMEEARPGYGGANSTYIIDGPGISLTRNSQFYEHGRTEVSFNKCYRNGVNGIAVHKTFRVRVIGNQLWDNGQVPKAPAPEDRQPYAGLTLNQSEDVVIMDNEISVTDPTDFGYVLVGNASYDQGEAG